jgi:hypothetical protein
MLFIIYSVIELSVTICDYLIKTRTFLNKKGISVLSNIFDERVCENFDIINFTIIIGIIIFYTYGCICHIKYAHIYDDTDDEHNDSKYYDNKSDDSSKL